MSVGSIEILKMHRGERWRGQRSEIAFSRVGNDTDMYMALLRYGGDEAGTTHTNTKARALVEGGGGAHGGRGRAVICVRRTAVSWESAVAQQPQI